MGGRGPTTKDSTGDETARLKEEWKTAITMGVLHKEGCRKAEEDIMWREQAADSIYFKSPGFAGRLPEVYQISQSPTWENKSPRFLMKQKVLLCSLS